MLTDFHTHIFPDKIADKTIKLLESNIKEEYRPHKAELRGTLDSQCVKTTLTYRLYFRLPRT